MNAPDLREQLAVERTHLANERTLLAYLRTAFGLAAAGAGMIRFLSNERGVVTLGWVLVVTGTLLGVFGGVRFASVRERLKSRGTE